MDAPMENDSVIIVCVIVMVLFFGSILLVKSIYFINWFFREQRCLNNEIMRTCNGERQYWIRQKRRLWLSLLPFVKY